MCFYKYHDSPINEFIFQIRQLSCLQNMGIINKPYKLIDQKKQNSLHFRVSQEFNISQAINQSIYQVTKMKTQKYINHTYKIGPKILKKQ
ncbi:hypothetical protein pb186bvf_003153 [Paramecium bursaria]